jgi:hypothetical protein
MSESTLINLAENNKKTGIKTKAGEGNPHNFFDKKLWEILSKKIIL